MPWNNQGNNGGGPWGGGGNGGNNGGNPWGSGGGPQRPSGRPNPPDLEKVFNEFKSSLGGKVPGSGAPKRLIIFGLIILLGIWAATGFYRVNPQQQGVVLRFGEWIRTTGPGLHYHLPFPIEQVMTPDVTRDNRLEIGFRDIAGSSATRRDIIDESLMITGDENIVDIDFVVF